MTKATPKALTKDPSNKDTMDRRKRMTSLLNLNRASGFIPGILDECRRMHSTLKDGVKQDMGNSINCLIFEIIANIFFGDDVNEITKKLRAYKNPDGTVEQIPIRDMLTRLPKAFLMQLYNPLTTALPFLNNYDLAGPYKRDRENLECCRQGLDEALKATQDKKSVYYQLTQMDGYKKDVMFDDLMSFTVAAFETSAKTICSTLYFLKKKPLVLKKLREELKENGFTKGVDIKEICTMEKVQDLDYMTNVIKEAMRIDSPVSETFPYTCLEDVEICGVPLPKDTMIKLDLYTGHYDETAWLHPREFIPERFDVESDFYKLSVKEGKERNVYSRRTFSHGFRMCPGQSLGFLQVRVILAYLLSHIDYEFEPELLVKEGVGFGFGSEIPFEAKVIKEFSL